VKPTYLNRTGTADNVTLQNLRNVWQSTT